MVAYDEEWESRANWQYGYSGQEFAQIIFEEGTYPFWYFEMEGYQLEVAFYIKAWRTWDSYDYPANEDVMMNETIRETGYSKGMIIDGEVIHALVAFTDQEIPNCYGYADHIEGVVLVAEYTTLTGGQHTDNILQHELSHFYGITEEDEPHTEAHWDCVVNTGDHWMPFPDYHNIPYGMVTHNWCELCFYTIWNNRANFGYWYNKTGGGRVGLRCPY